MDQTSHVSEWAEKHFEQRIKVFHKKIFFEKLNYELETAETVGTGEILSRSDPPLSRG